MAKHKDESKTATEEPTQKTTSAQDESAPKSEFLIQRIYVKDISYETPQTPVIFQQEWKPDLNLQINTTTSQLTEGVHEVVLKLTVTVKSADKVAFLAEVKQAGIFTAQHFADDQLHAILGGVCPGILFPYARETISDLVTRGTFPPLYLAPINFDALYLQQLEQQKKQSTGTASTTQQ